MANAPIPAGYAPVFSTMTGHQGYFYQPAELSAWAVRPGDVAPAAPPIPEPDTYVLLLAGLAMLTVVAHRRSKKYLTSPNGSFLPRAAQAGS